MSSLGVCRHCGARIRWFVTQKGKRMPVDQEPNELGNVVIEYSDLHGGDHCRVLLKDEMTDRTRFMPHAASCDGRGDK